MGTALAFCHGRFGRTSLYRINKPLAPHAHREGHLVFLVEGAAATVSVDGTPHTVSEDRCIAISPWQPHDFRPSDWGRGAVFLVLYVAPRWFEELAAGPVLRFGAPTVPVGPALRAGVLQVASMLADGRMCGRFSERLHALALAAFEETWSLPNSAVTPTWPRLSDYRIRNALRLMNERVSDACALDRIARDAGLSRPHFYKLFRQNIGLTPNMYLNTLRVERSIRRLTQSDDPVTAIGLDLGFASQASFTRFFSNNVGIAPTDYRRGSLMAA